MATKNFKSGAAYKNYLGYIHANNLDKPGGDDVTIKGKKHKVDRSAAKQTTNMKTNQDGGGKSSTEAADQLKKLGSPAKSIRVKPKEASSDSPAKMNRYDKDMMHERELIYDAKKQKEYHPEDKSDDDKLIYDAKTQIHNEDDAKHAATAQKNSFAMQFNDKSPMNQFKDFDQMDTWDAKATAGESPATQYRLGQKISRKGDTTSFEMRPDGEEFSEEDNAMITNMKEHIISNAEYNRRMKPSGGKGKMSKVVKSITKQHKSPVYKDGSMAGDQSATHTDYTHYKGTDPGYHPKDGEAHGDQSATHIDYVHPIFKHMKR